MFVVGNAALKGGDPSSSAEPSSISAGGYASVTVALAVSLGVVVAILVIILVVAVVRSVHASERKSTVDRQHAPDVTAAASGGSTRVTGSLSSWGFDSIRSKYSITSEDSIAAQSSQ